MYSNTLVNDTCRMSVLVWNFKCACYFTS